MFLQKNLLHSYSGALKSPKTQYFRKIFWKKAANSCCLSVCYVIHARLNKRDKAVTSKLSSTLQCLLWATENVVYGFCVLLYLCISLCLFESDTNSPQLDSNSPESNPTLSSDVEADSDSGFSSSSLSSSSSGIDNAGYILPSKYIKKSFLEI